MLNRPDLFNSQNLLYTVELTFSTFTPSYNYPSPVVADSFTLVTGDPVTITFTINPNPSAGFTYAIVSPNSNDDFTFTNTSSIGSGSLTYKWDFGDGTTSTLKDPTHTYADSGSYTVTLIALSDNGCADTITQTLTVNKDPNVVVAFTLNAAVQCLFENNFVFTDSTSVAAGSSVTGYEWDFGDGTTSSLPNPAHSYQAAGIYIVSLKITTNTGFTDSISQSVEVFATPAVTKPADQIVCNGSATTGIIFAGSPDNNTYTWTNNYPGIGLAASGSTGSIPSFTAINNTGTPVIATIEITPYANGCAGTPQQFTITVNPSAKNADITVAGIDSVCVGDSVRLIASSSTITNPVFTWYEDAELSLQAFDGSSFTTPPMLNTDVTYYVTVSGENVCANLPEDAKAVTVTVKPHTIPEMISVNDTTICSGFAVTRTAVAPLVNNAQITWYSDADLKNPVGSGLSFTTPVLDTTTTWYVTAQGTNYCENQPGIAKAVTVNVNPSPVVVITDPAPVCADAGVDITSPAITQGSDAGLIYAYYSDVLGTVPLTAPAQITVPGTYYIQGTDITTGCVGDPKPVNVAIGSNITIVPAITGATCNGSGTGAISISVSGGTAPYAYQWTGPNGYNSAAKDITNVVAGNYVVDVMDALGCTNADTFSIGEPGGISIVPVVTDISCNGSNTGAISISLSGGSGAYTYNWTGPNGFISSGKDLTGLAAGNYSVTVTDSAGCVASITTSVAEASVINITAAIANVACNGKNTGSIDITVSGGNGGYTYTWTGDNGFSSVSEDIINLLAGSYSVSVRDGTGCSNSITRNVSEPSPISITPAVTDISCNGDSTGAVSLVVGGGSGAGFTYSWTGPNGFTSAAQNISGLKAGNYHLIVTDNAGCSDSITALISEAAAISITPTVTDISCNGDSTGAVSLVVGGGSGAGFTYSWTGPNGFTSAAQNISGLKAGNYHLIVTDNAGCSDSITALISEAAAISITPTVTDISCNGDSTGAVSLVVGGGSGAGFTYSWTGPNGFTSAAQNISGLKAGNYHLIVTDNAGCSDSITALISEAAAISITPTVTDISCNGDSTGAVSLVVGGGSGAGFTYSWTGPNGFTSAAQNISGLKAGNYHLIVTDNAGCSDSITALISEAAAISITPTVTDISCNGDSTGAVSLVVGGGSGAGFTYSWTGPNGFTSAAQNISGLKAGNYHLIVTDNAGCSDSITALISEAAAISITPTVTDISCNGDSTGAVSLVVGGGSGAGFTYSWTGPNGFTSAAQNISGLKAGNYHLIVTDNAGCSDSITALISEAAAISITPTVTDISCNGDSTGAVSLVVGGGSGAGFTYSWTGPNGFTSAAQNISGLKAGNYHLIVTDNAGCSDSITALISEAAAISITPTVTDISCNGDSTGAVSLVVGGGSGAGFTYSWTGPNGFTSAAQNISGLKAGNYHLIVTDNAGCSDSITALISEAAAISITPTVTDISCNGDSTGAVSLVVGGGSGAGFTYSWTGPNGFTSAAQNISGLKAGNYHLIVTDNAGCSDSITALISEAAAISITPTVTDISCNGDSTGAVSLVVGGGSGAGFTYSWTGPNGFTSAAQNISGLKAGNYHLIVTDNAGCSDSITALISEAAAISITPTVTDISCNGDSTGAVSLVVGGGSGAGFTYSWTGPNGFTSAAQNISGLKAGNYHLIVTDNAGCSDSITALISEAAAISITPTVTDISCNGDSTGAVSLVVGGGSGAGFTYSWTGPNGFTSAAQNISGLKAGNYHLIVTDNAGCSDSITALISEAAAISITPTVTDISCNGDSTGAVSLVVGGGSGAGFTYSWTGPNGFTSAAQNISGLKAGNYHLIVTDNAGCSDSITALISEAAAISITPTVTDISCNGDSTGAVSLVVGGGSGAGFTYSWTGPNGFTSAAQNISGLKAGNYHLIVTDNAGCSDSITALISEAAAISITPTVTDISCNGDSTGAVSLVVGGGSGAGFTYSWTGPNGFTSAAQNISGLKAGNYHLIVTDNAGCSDSITALISEAAAISITPTVTDISCNGDSTGAVSLVVGGGSGAGFTYSWTGPNGFTSAAQNISGLKAGNYHLIVTDNAGCSDSITALISEAAAISITPTVTDISCNGDSTGAVSLVVGGGSGAGFTYSWTGPNGFTSAAQNISGLKAGNYHLIVTDNAGCSDSITALISEAAAISITPTVTDISCNGDSTGAVSLVVGGGSGAGFTYSWTGPNGFTSAAQNISGLKAGNYHLIVTDNAGCSDSITALISEAAAISITPTVTDISCNGDSTGAVSLVVGGGSGAGFTYSWTGPNGFTSAAQNISGLKAGNYHLIVTDNAGCSDSITALISEAAAISITPTVTDISCNGDSTGAVSLVVGGGSGAGFTYSWTGPNGFTSAAQNISGLKAGNYHLIVTDNAGCSDSITALISEAAAISITPTVTDISCNGDSTGAVSLVVGGGSGAGFTYSWTGPNGFTSAAQNISGLKAGNYHLIVTDNAGCSDSITALISEAAAISITPTVTDISCNGDSTGAVSLVVGGGSGAGFTYSWTGPNGFTSAAQNISGLKAGNYHLIVTDNAGCSDSITALISEAAAISITPTVTDISCNGDSTGAVSLVVGGGSGAGFTYSWTGPNGFTSAAQNISGLKAGNYHLIVTDNAGCSDSITALISEAAAISITPTVTDISCNGDSTGAVSLVVGGGSGAGFTYSWTGPNGFTSAAQNISGLKAGNYHLIVTDNAGCSDSITALISEAAAISITPTVTDISCNGDSTGAVSLVVGGGSGAGFTYSWTGPNGFTSAAQNISGLKAGNYTVEVTDGNGCTAIIIYTVAEPSALSITEIHTDVSTNGGTNGSINISVSGGGGSYSYSWTGPGGFTSTSADISNLISGTYSLVVTDINGCGDTIKIFIAQPDRISVSELHSDVSCNNGSNGSININVTGGTTPYTYSWTGPDGYTATTQDINGLIAGVYTAIITDNAVPVPHADTIAIAVAEPAIINPTPVITNVSCNDVDDGAINLNVSGGSGSGYTYSWTGPNGFSSVLQNISNLHAGSYEVLITDGTGCTIINKYIVAEPASMGIAATVTALSCNGSNTGAVDLTVTGGTAPYTYNWTGPDGFVSATQDISGLAAGNYTIVVTDAAGCTATASIAVSEPASMGIAAAVTALSCNGSNTGAVDLTVTGGTAPYTYNWTGPDGFVSATQDISGLAAGSYTIVVTDAAGCTATASIAVSEPASMGIAAAVTALSCNGSNTGAVDLTVTGGTAPYTYNWTGPDGYTGTAEDLNSLAAGSYTIVVTDAAGCTATASIAVSEPASMGIAAAVTALSCNGSNTGAVDLTVTGGTAPYTYNWTGPDGFVSATQDISGLAAGNYTIVVTDAAGCTATASIAVSEPASMGIAAAVTALSCNGSNTGAVDLTVTGGTAPYTYNWTGPDGFVSATQDISGLAAGNYTIVVTDAAGCTATASIAVSEPASMGIAAAVTALSCNGSNTGAVDLTVTGGTAPYTYNWTGPDGFVSATQDISGLAAGNYMIVVTDAAGCTATASIAVSEPASMGIAAAVTALSCNGSNTGAVDLTVTGGTAPYTYNWTGPDGFVSATQDISGLAAGNYTIVVTDAAGCTATASIAVSEPASMGIAAAVTALSCNGSNTGAVDLTVTGGTAPYTYNWTGPDGYTGTAEDLNSLAAGSYTIVVTDAAGCTATASIAVSEPASMGIAAAVTALSCNGSNTGAVDLTVTGGTAPYTYNWTGPDGFVSATQDISGLAAGNYTIVVTDAAGCTATASIAVSEPASMGIAAAVTALSCNGSNTGAVDLTVTGGTAPYTYNWTGPDGYTGTAEDLNSLAAGNYTIVVTDAAGCTATASIAVSEPASMGIAAAVTALSCNGSNTGAVDLTVTGGTAPYTYNWTGPDGFVSATQDISGLAAGNYMIVVTDAAGCTATASIAVSEPASMGIAAAVTALSCNGSNTGAVDLTVTGGTAPYTYNWTGPDGFVSATQDISGLAAGNYTIVVTDAAGCTATASIAVSEPASMGIAAAVTALSCNGSNTGAVDLTVTGGTAPYTYNWTGPDGFVSATQDISGLAAGNYMIVVTDAAGCTATASIAVSEPASMGIAAAVTALSCNGSNTGAVDLTVTGGTAPYTYNWTGPDGFVSATQDISGLAAGNYTIVVTDAAGCTATASIAVSEPASMGIAAAVTALSCNGSNTGAVDLTVTGGTAPYTYNWTGPDGFVSATQDISGLAAGNYTIVVTDAAGCTATASIAVSEPASMGIAAAVTALSCNGSNTGAVDLTVTGGTAPYTYNWTGPDGFVSATQDISGLAAGNYMIVVTDAAGCTATASIAVSEPASMGIAAAVTALSCNGSNTGAVDLTVTGGTAPYTYNWTGPDGFISATQDISGLAAGNYMIVVTDAAGCTATASIAVSEPASMGIAAAVTALSCNGSNTGAVDLTVTGGTAPYTYNWTGPDGFVSATQDISGLAAGNYTIVVTDAAGCTATASIAVSEPASMGIAAAVTALSCNGSNTGAVDLTVTGGTAPYTYNWTGPDGFVSATQDISGLAAGNYTIVVTDAAGCTATASIAVSEPASMGIAAAVTALSCNGSNTGAVDLTVTGGTAPYTYNWTGPDGFVSATQDISGLAAGNYTIVVTDAAGCTATASIAVSEPASMGIAAAVTALSCNGSNTGAVDLTVTGGTAPYTYNWTVPDGYTSAAEDLTTLAAGNYTIVVTDAAGCTATASIAVSEPASMGIAAAVTALSCNGSNTGAVDLTVTGGTAPYTYNWTGPDGFVSATQDISGLAAGNYMIVVTDAAGCTATASIAVSEPLTISINTTVTDITCNGDSTGAVSLTTLGGSGSYTYKWTGPDGFTSTIQNINGLVTGYYSVAVTDAAGCTTTTAVIVSEPAATLIVPDVISLSCNGDSTGAIDLKVSGGNGSPYTYSWTGPDGFVSGSQNISGLKAGNYTVIVTDNTSCSILNKFIISQPLAIKINPVIIKNVTCNGGNDGAIAINVTLGSIPGFTYNWVGPNGFTSADKDITGLYAGVYTVTVTDVFGCSATNTMVIGEPARISIQDSAINNTCYGDKNGSIYLTATGGTAPYTYSWTGPDGFVSTSKNINNLSAGSYTVTVMDSAGCTATQTIDISEPLPITVVSNVSTVACNGSNSGSITLFVNGGTGGYTYHWTGPDGFTASSQNIANLKAGNYTVTITDSSICSVSINLTVTEPTPISLTYSSSGLTCADNNDGSVNITATGGTPPYTYHWNTGDTTQNLTKIAGGIYRVTVTDNMGCTVQSDSIVIHEPAKINMRITPPPAICNPATIDLTAPAIVEGSDQGLVYSYYYDSVATQPVNNPSAITTTGVYYIKGTSAGGCYLIMPVPVTINAASSTPLITITPPVDQIAIGDQVTLTASASYAGTWQWYHNGVAIPGATTNSYVIANFQNDGNGIYRVDVYTPEGCRYEGKDTLLLSVTDFTTRKEVTDNSGDGIVQPGETLSYTIYVKNTGSTSIRDITIIDPVPDHTTYTGEGHYNEITREVVFVDQNLNVNEERAYTFTVAADSILQGVNYILNQAVVTCDSSEKPTDSVRIPVGELFVDLKIVKSTSANATFIGEQFNYTITVENNSNITAHNVLVTDSLPAELNHISSIANTGIVNILPGTQGSTISWKIDSLPAQANATLTVTVTGNEAGSVLNTATVRSDEPEVDTTNNRSTVEKEVVAFKIPNVFTPNGDGRNETFFIKGLDLYAENELLIFNRWNANVYQKKNYQNDWDGSGLNEGTYFYILRLKDDEGKWHLYKGNVLILRH